MLLRGPNGGNLRVTLDGVIRQPTLERNIIDSSSSHGMGQLQVLFKDMLNVQIVEECKIKISFADFSINKLEVKTFCQESSDMATLQNVYTTIKVTTNCIALLTFAR